MYKIELTLIRFALFQTRILITHGVTYLPLMDKIFVMDEGKIVKAGTYQQLLNENGFFANFLQTYGNDESQQTEESPSGIANILLTFFNTNNSFVELGCIEIYV